MNQIPICVMTQVYPVTMCPKFAALRSRKKFQINQIVDLTIDCGLGTAIARDRAANWKKREPGSNDSLLRKLGRQGRKLLVLRFCRQALVGLGVVDHLTQKFLAHNSRAVSPFLTKHHSCAAIAPASMRSAR